MTENNSGIAPVEYKVLIKPRAVEEKVGSIYIPDQNRDREQWAEMRGTIVAVAPMAFSYASDEEWNGAKPVPGDEVITSKYAGVNIKGPRDGEDYRLVNDKEICAKVEA